MRNNKIPFCQANFEFVDDENKIINFTPRVTGGLVMVANLKTEGKFE